MTGAVASIETVCRLQSDTIHIQDTRVRPSILRMAASVITGVQTDTGVGGKGKLMDKLSNYIIVDIGANLTNKKFSRDLDQVIQRATDSGNVM